MQSRTPDSSKPASSSTDKADCPQDPLANVPRPDRLPDRFSIQPGDIAFIVVGSIEVINHSGDAELDADDEA